MEYAQGLANADDPTCHPKDFGKIQRVMLKSLHFAAAGLHA
jgi:hypothetical protein